MIGCFAHALKAEINVDRREIADARWFTPAEIENGTPATLTAHATAHAHG
jgi:NADH pyrophosphatase NudC (nudix superfamily)